jgi:hypothetical protein
VPGIFISAAQSAEQRGKFAPVLFRDSSEFQPQPASGHAVRHNGIGANLPFTHQEVNLCWRANHTK